MTDAIAERVRKVGGSTITSIGHVNRIQRIADNDADFVEPSDMIAELREDNQTLKRRRATRSCEARCVAYIRRAPHAAIRR